MFIVVAMKVFINWDAKLRIRAVEYPGLLVLT